MNKHIKNTLSLHIGNLVALVLMICGIYYVLLQDNMLNISISSIIEYSHHLKNNKHLLVLGLLPIYIATIVFGAAIVAIYIGSILQNIYTKLFLKKSAPHRC